MTRPTFSQLAAQDDFLSRHIGPSAAEQADMLAALGCSTLDQLTEKIVPAAIRSPAPLNLPAPKSEVEVLRELKTFAARNKINKNYIGMGYYGTYTPNVILRNVLENPAWYTAYTPYQPEISQGRLEALINFQTMVSDLTGLAIANASLLDEATAAAEAMTLARRFTKARSDKFFVSRDCHPQTIAVIQTRAPGFGIEVIVGDAADAAKQNVFGLLLQYPASTGALTDPRKLIAEVQANGVVVVMAADLLALALITPPGELGADIAVGSTQRFGVPLGFGGPHAAYLACRDDYKRQLPGRLVGVSIDRFGKPAYRLTLQTREQHIRREKATSNICTAQVLLAVMAGMYATYHGPEGIARIARYVNRVAATFAAGLKQLKVAVSNESYFDTICINSGSQTDAIYARALAAGINLRRVDAATLSVSVDETTRPIDVENLWKVFAPSTLSFDTIERDVADTLPASLTRTSAYLTHPVFSSHHSETEMLRYLRSLSDKDLALDRTMIPLGSCTMKLNATAEMIPVTWPEFANLHPFAPKEQSEGYRAMIESLEQALVEITGYDAVSLQPNSGAQGEYAGLLAIAAYHRARGEGHRNIVLIPSSAHGTNPASAQMVGMQVVVVACDAKGNVDVADLEAKANEHSKDLAALMVTYPSTHGVFEDAIVQICDIVHQYGGQVYLDGANMNALVGVAKPGKFGADVSHLNLHKTFCIPHGGGGPGVGPVAVRAHLAPYLPAQLSSTSVTEGGNHAIGPVSAAPYGSAGILAISWAYIAMMGASGLKQATQVAMLNANYIAKCLNAHYPVLYTGQGDLVAHECILDPRALKETSGVSAEDIAKRLIDFGFHAPTLSFPVANTLMVEPTESESKMELDRFIDAMVAIRREIQAVAEGRMDREDNPLKNAPHTATMITAEEWVHDYSRQQAAFPGSTNPTTKYWPPVARIDSIYGDKNVFCSCPPLLTYQQTATESAAAD
ncbi:MAG: aminomethyl-transferring glycine dehydrogenase [Betaproteobacteria bacterium]|nr:aminomethyl-transferring glycine dehydrogenase [Betaproteobacteria bacterium]